MADSVALGSVTGQDDCYDDPEPGCLNPAAKALGCYGMGTTLTLLVLYGALLLVIVGVTVTAVRRRRIGPAEVPPPWIRWQAASQVPPVSRRSRSGTVVGAVLGVTLAGVAMALSGFGGVARRSRER